MFTIPCISNFAIASVTLQFEFKAHFVWISAVEYENIIAFSKRQETLNVNSMN